MRLRILFAAAAGAMIPVLGSLILAYRAGRSAGAAQAARTSPGTLPDSDEESALIYAGKHRMRAITMSTIAAVLALSPLALGIGQGSAMQRPLAIAIISGLLFQLPLIFLLMPVLFRVLRVKRM
jgi:Cu/Ag efflux pump CusA